MATVQTRCQRCHKFRPVFLQPVDKTLGGRLVFICLECVGDLSKLEQKPRVIQK